MRQRSSVYPGAMEVVECPHCGYFNYFCGPEGLTTTQHRTLRFNGKMEDLCGHCNGYFYLSPMEIPPPEKVANEVMVYQGGRGRNTVAGRVMYS